MKIKLYKNDLPANIKFSKSVAIDTEAMGLNHSRDRLCLIQLSEGDGICHLIKIDTNGSGLIDYSGLLKICSFLIV